ncbi:MAG: S41 family peptidase [Rhodomicrobium sp.]
MRILAALAGVVMLLCFAAGTVGADAQSQPNAQDAQLKEVQVASEAFTLGDPVPQWIEEAALPEASAEERTSLRLLDTQFLAGDAPASFVRRALLIKDQPALTAAGQIAIRFVPEYQHLQLHALRVLRAGETIDQTRSAQVRFLQRETGLERGMYSGVVTASILVNDLRVGDTLEVLYSVQGQNPVFGSKMVQNTLWDAGYSTALRRAIVKTPKDRKIYWRFQGDGARQHVTPVETQGGGLRTLVFEERNVAAAVAEPLTPPDYIALRSLQFSEFSSWDDVAAWGGQLFQVTDTANAEFRQAVDKFRAVPTAAGRVSAALEFVQSEIRYFSVSIGVSSHRPAQPSTLLARRFGDCKDKSLLLVSLLKELDIEAYPVLVKAGGRKWLEKALPSPADFDHVIVLAVVDGKRFYLDPTRLGQHGRLDRMGQIHEGTLALPLGPQVPHQLVTITAPDGAGLADSDISENFAVTKLGGPAQLRFREVWYGVGAETRRVLQSALSKGQLVGPFASAMEARYPGAKLSGEPEISDDQVNNVYTMTLPYSIPNLGVEKDGFWAIRYQPSNIGGALPAAIASSRTMPASIPLPGYHAKYNLEVQFPAKVSSMLDPVTKMVEDKHFVFLYTQSFRGSVAKASLDLKTLTNRVQVPDVTSFVQKVHALNELGVGAIAVMKSDIQSAGGQASGMKEKMYARAQDAMDKATEAMKSGKLTGTDLGRAHCLRSQLYGYLGKFDEAFADASEALKIAPNAGEMSACQGFVYFLHGDFAKSIAAYNTAVVLGDIRPETFKSRGFARYYASQLEEAAEDFVKASDTGDKADLLYTYLWLAWTNERRKKPMEEVSKAIGEAEIHGEWPHPALAMFAGKLSPEEMLKTLDTKTGDERNMALAEGYFYAGEYYLAHGNKEKARELFTRTRELNVLLYIEHVCAGFELTLAGAAGGNVADKPAAPSGGGDRRRESLAAPTEKAPPANLAPLGLFGTVLERIRTYYVDKVDDRALARNAILGVAASEPRMQGHPATKKALSSLETAPADIKADVEILGIFFFAAKQETNDSLDKLVSAAIDGMLKGLDSQSKYLRNPQKNCEPPNGGIGIELRIENEAVRVVRALDSSPALEAGIRSGDILTRLDGALLKGLSSEEVVAKLCGPLDSAVAVSLTRKTELQPLEVNITRETVRITPVEYSIVDDAGWIKVKSFKSPDTFDALKHTILWNIQPVAGSKLKGYILDLRDNSGGLLDQAVKVASAFAGSGTIVLEQGHDSTERKLASGGDLTGGKPVVVLINHYTASGAEAVASSLQDTHRATIVGTRSFGAGTVQTLIQLDGQRTLKLTTHRLLRANGRSWDGKGVEPDITVHSPPESTANEQPDPDLAAALDILRRKK